MSEAGAGASVSGVCQSTESGVKSWPHGWAMLGTDASDEAQIGAVGAPSGHSGRNTSDDSLQVGASLPVEALMGWAWRASEDNKGASIHSSAEMSRAVTRRAGRKQIARLPLTEVSPSRSV